ncbi:hypothetical protein LIER_21626 [Lithospermum erythrorhizon]|uniref:TTF-type domain-containing protein n=1 Tax=Lithospermum erythrorhizon TaxID=34254 RepID=A0AAV3QR11_LITER
MGKTTRIDSYFKGKEQPNPLLNYTQPVEVEPPTTSVELPNLTGNNRARIEEFDIDAEDCDPSERPQIWEYPVNKRDEIRRKYINRGPCRVPMKEYPASGPSSHLRKFQESWFVTHPWLEYSKAKDATFCLPCFLFNRPENPKIFTITGFRNWKKVKNRINDCAFFTHMGEPNSFHDNAVKSVLDLMNQAQHITHAFDRHKSQNIAENRMRLKVSIGAVLYLILQGLPLRGHDKKK